ncbi:2'-5' RNA ligase family protein [Rhizobium sp. A22-96]
MKNNGQLSLNLGGGSRRKRSQPDQAPISKLYFAILPDPVIATHSHQLAWGFRGQYGFSAKPPRVDLLHITLYEIGAFHDIPEEIAFAAMQAASTIGKSSFQVAFDRAVSFGSKDNRPLVLWNKDGNAELKALHRELDDAMRMTGFKRIGEKSVEPHMTLLYRGHLVPEIMLEEPVTWTAKDFVLINSLQGQSIHDHLCYWTLRD